MTLEPTTMQGDVPAQEVATEGQAPAGDFDKLFDGLADRIAGSEPPAPDPAPASDGQDEGQGEQAPQPQEEGPDAPQHWPNDQKEAFRALAPEARQVVLERNRVLEGMYGKKFEEVAARQKQLEAWETLNRRIQTDPKFAQHVFGYDQQSAQRDAEEQPPVDPIERIKWEARREAIKEFAPHLEQMRQEMSLAQHQQSINQTLARVQADPMYQQVQQSILEYVTGLPESVGRAVYQQLDSNPQAYMEMYQRTRERVAGQQPAQAQTRGADGRFASQQPAQEPPKPVQRRERAPVLESAGAASDAPSVNAKAQREIAARMKAGQATSDDLGAYLKATGALGRLIAE